VRAKLGDSTPPLHAARTAQRLSSRGRVLGIDVGFSQKRKTTGLCSLWWDEESIDWRCEVAGTDEASRLLALERLTLSRSSVIDAVAIDGPLRPGLVYRVSYRAAECILSRGKIQRRGKPGPTNGGSGPKLHEAATELAKLSMRHLEVRDTDVTVKVCPAAIVEAFPNLFLGTLCEESEYPIEPAVHRRWTDTLFPMVTNKLEAVLVSLLPCRRLDGSLELEDHEDVAAFACAITALCVAAGQFEAVGSPDDGFMVLSAERFWGKRASGLGSWAGFEIERTVEMARESFATAERRRT